MVNVTVKWGKESTQVEVDTSEPGLVFKSQLYALFGVPVERQKIMGFKGGILKDEADMGSLDIKEGQKVTLVGTAEGKEIKAPTEKTMFMEDLTAADKARLLKEKKMEPLPRGLENLGNTCYLNSVVQFLKPSGEFLEGLREMRANYSSPDGNVATALKETYHRLDTEVDPVQPFSLIKFLRDRFPQFAQTTSRGQPMQQDSEEVLQCLFESLVRSTQTPGQATNLVDKLFQFNLHVQLKCLENETEEPTTETSAVRKLSAFLGDQVKPIDHLHQGLSLSLDETIEKESPSLGRTAAYSKVARVTSLPEYLIIHLVRFEWKKAHELARTDACKTKITRKMTFPRSLDIYEFSSDDLKEQLRPAREVLAERAEKAASARNEEKKPSDKKDDKEKEGGEKKDTEMADASAAAANGGEKKTEGEAVDASGPAPMDVDAGDGASEKPTPMPSGHFELQSIVTHQGRAADAGHYIAWVKKNKSEKEWLKYDDDKVSEHVWEQIDLQGGRGDYHIAYLLLYKRSEVTASKEELEEARAAREARIGAAGKEGGKAAEKDAAESSSSSSSK